MRERRGAGGWGWVPPDRGEAEGDGLHVGEERTGRKGPNVHTYTWLALCSANSQIVLSRSKAECDREGLHTLNV